MHVIPIRSRWSVRKSGAKRSSRVFKTEQEAIDYAKEKARQQKTILYIHDRTGKICDRISFTAYVKSIKAITIALIFGGMILWVLTLDHPEAGATLCLEHPWRNAPPGKDCD